MAENDRFLTIGLPEDAGAALLIRSFEGTEQLGQPFQFRVELLGEKAVDPTKMIGQNVTVRLNLGDGTARYFNGYVARFVQLINEGRHYSYAATLVPWTWFLSRQANCRLFHKNAELDLLKKTKVPEIITEIWKDAGVSSELFGDDKLGTTYPERELTVQYRETTFNFCQRLMEQEGIYYYFDHVDGKHKLVLCDSPANHEDMVRAELPVRSGGGQPTDDEEITDWIVEREIQPMHAALADFDFRKPNTPLDQLGTDTLEVENNYEIFDYPGEYTETSDGDRLARIRAEELAGQYLTIRGRATIRTMTVGYKFKLTGDLRTDQKGEYLVTAVTHRAVCDITESGESSDADGYVCSFVARPAERQYRPPRVTPRPVISGPQTAIVTGGENDEIHVDPDGYGCVKVQFHWDRYGAGNENSSPWIRVSQSWAGKKYGIMFLPRVGHEVIVEFLEGDPDRPIVTGRVYNDENMPPLDLPGDKTMSTIKTSTSTGGEGFNEIRFEDKKDHEQIFMNAQKNMDVRVKEDSFQYIGHEKHVQVEKDNYTWNKLDNHVITDRDQLEQIKRDRNLTVEGKEAKSVAKSLSLKVADDVIEEFGAKHSEVVTKDYYLKADNICLEAATNITIKVGSDYYIAISSQGIKLGSAAKIALESSSDMSLKTQTSLQMEASSNAQLKGTSGVKVSGATVEAAADPGGSVKLDANAAVKGAQVMLG